MEREREREKDRERKRETEKEREREEREREVSEWLSEGSEERQGRKEGRDPEVLFVSKRARSTYLLLPLIPLYTNLKPFLFSPSVVPAPAAAALLSFPPLPAKIILSREG